MRSESLREPVRTLDDAERPVRCPPDRGVSTRIAVIGFVRRDGIPYHGQVRVNDAIPAHSRDGACPAVTGTIGTILTSTTSSIPARTSACISKEGAPAGITTCSGAVSYGRTAVTHTFEMGTSNGGGTGTTYSIATKGSTSRLSAGVGSTGAGVPGIYGTTAGLARSNAAAEIRALSRG